MSNVEIHGKVAGKPSDPQQSISWQVHLVMTSVRTIKGTVIKITLFLKHALLSILYLIMLSFDPCRISSKWVSWLLGSHSELMGEQGRCAVAQSWGALAECRESDVGSFADLVYDNSVFRELTSQRLGHQASIPLAQDARGTLLLKMQTSPTCYSTCPWIFIFSNMKKHCSADEL